MAHPDLEFPETNLTEPQADDPGGPPLGSTAIPPQQSPRAEVPPDRYDQLRRALQQRVGVQVPSSPFQRPQGKQPWTPQPPKPQPAKPGTPTLSPTGGPPKFRTEDVYRRTRPDNSRKMGEVDDNHPPPQGHEVPSIFQGVGEFFQQFGSGLTKPLGYLSNVYSAAYIKAYNEGMEQKQQYMREQMMNFNMQLETQARTEAMRYGRAIEKYDATHDLIGFEKEVGDIARDLSDDDIAKMIGNTSWNNIIAYLRNRDAHWHDLYAGVSKALEEDQNADRFNKDWGTGKQPPQEQPPAEAAPTDRPPPTEGTQPQPAAPAPAPTAERPPPVAGVDYSEFNGGAPRNAMQQWGYERSRYNQVKIPGSEEKRGDVDEFAAKVQSAVNNIETAARNKTLRPEQIMPALAAIDQQRASDLNGLLDYTNDPKSGGKNRMYFDPLANLAHAVRPGWNEQNFDLQKDFRKESGMTQRTLLSASGMAIAGKQLAETVGKLPPDAQGNIIRREYARWQAGWRGSGVYTDLFNAWQAYNIDYINLLSATGRGSVSESRDRTASIALSGSPRQFYGVLGQDAAVALNRIETRQLDWAGMDGQGRMPGLHADAVKDLHDLAKLGSSVTQSGPPPDAVEYLKAHPETRATFDKHWPGFSAQILGQ